MAMIITVSAIQLVVALLIVHQVGAKKRKRKGESR